MDQRTLLRKAGIWIVSSILPLLLLTWMPIVMMAPHQESPTSLHKVIPMSIQAASTSTDPTVTALQKEQLSLQVDQLQHNWSNWLWNNAAAVTIVLGALIGIFRWFREQDVEREKRSEERFQTVVTGLGGEKPEAQIGAAIMLRTFLHPGYNQFYNQAFDLSVAYLRIRKADPNVPEDQSSLSLALIVVFKESFPKARDHLQRERREQNTSEIQRLNAAKIQLDNAYLSDADLRKAWMPQAFLRKAILHRTKLSGALLTEANCAGADLSEADLTGAALRRANLTEVDFTGADLSGASLRGANLARAKLQRVKSLKGARMFGATGLTQDQLDICRAKGALIE